MRGLRTTDHSVAGSLQKMIHPLEITKEQSSDQKEESID